MNTAESEQSNAIGFNRWQKKYSLIPIQDIRPFSANAKDGCELNHSARDKCPGQLKVADPISGLAALSENDPNDYKNDNRTKTTTT